MSKLWEVVERWGGHYTVTNEPESDAENGSVKITVTNPSLAHEIARVVNHAYRMGLVDDLRGVIGHV